MSTIKDLEILEKYLSEDELKEIAKSAAYSSFNNYINENNPNKKSNIEYFAKHGALLAMKDSMSDLDLSDLKNNFNKKVNSLIKSISWYSINDLFLPYLKKEIDNNSENIKNKVKTLIEQRINDDSNIDSVYNKLNDYIGETFTDLFYSVTKKYFNDNNK